jgi:hypothetical protein
MVAVVAVHSIELDCQMRWTRRTLISSYHQRTIKEPGVPSCLPVFSRLCSKGDTVVKSRTPALRVELLETRCLLNGTFLQTPIVSEQQQGGSSASSGLRQCSTQQGIVNPTAPDGNSTSAATVAACGPSNPLQPPAPTADGGTNSDQQGIAARPLQNPNPAHFIVFSSPPDATGLPLYGPDNGPVMIPVEALLARADAPMGPLPRPPLEGSAKISMAIVVPGEKGVGAPVEGPAPQLVSVISAQAAFAKSSSASAGQTRDINAAPLQQFVGADERAAQAQSIKANLTVQPAGSREDGGGAPVTTAFGTPQNGDRREPDRPRAVSAAFAALAFAGQTGILNVHPAQPIPAAVFDTALTPSSIRLTNVLQLDASALGPAIREFFDKIDQLGVNLSEQHINFLYAAGIVAMASLVALEICRRQTRQPDPAIVSVRSALPYSNHP